MADNEDIVQRVVIKVDDSELNKSMDKSKRLVADMQKKISDSTPSVRVSYDLAKGFSQVSKDAQVATKEVGKLSTAVTGLNAAATVVAAKNLGGAVKNLATETKQATVAQKELSKTSVATAATVAKATAEATKSTTAATTAATKAAKATRAPAAPFVPPDRRDPNTGRFLKKGAPVPELFQPTVGRDPRTGRAVRLPRTTDRDFIGPRGPRDFIGPQKPIGPPEFVGPRQPPLPHQRDFIGPREFVGPQRRPPRPGEQGFIGPRDQRPPLPPTDPRFIGPRRPVPSTDPNFIGPRQPIGPPRPPVPPIGTQIGTGIGGLIGIFGIASTAAATLGLAIVGLSIAFEAAGNKADKAASRLGAFTGGPEQGKATFEGVKDLANTLKVSATGLAKPFEELVRIGEGEVPQKQLQNTLGNLTKSMQAEKIPEKTGQEALTKLLADVREKGVLSKEALKSFEQIAPVTAKALTQSMEKVAPGSVARGDVPAATVLKAAGSEQFGSDAAARDLATKAAFVQSIGEAFDKLNAAVERLSSALGGGSIIATTLDALASLIDTLAAAAERLTARARGAIKGALVGGAVGAVGGFATPVPGGALVGAVGGAIGGAIAGGASAEELTQQERLNESFRALTESSKGAAKGTDDYGKHQKDLAAHSKRLSAEQAKLNLDFLPKEQAIQADRNQLNVTRADIAVQSAQIGLQEAAKQKELAGFAQGDARLRTDQAASSLEQIENQQRAARLRAMGVDPTKDPDQQRLEKSAAATALDLQERAARRALARAKVEEKFAHLEPAKAELAGRQAETALRSAEIEKRDSTLKLAKDEQGRPIDRDLAALRYANAQLEEQKKASNTLQEILAAIKNSGGGKEGKEGKDGTGPGTGLNQGFDGTSSGNAYVRNKSVMGADGVERINTIPTPNPNDTWLLDKSQGPRSEGGGGVDVEPLNKFANALNQATNATEDTTKTQELQQGIVQDAGTATGDTEKSMASLPAPVDNAAASADQLAESMKSLKKMGFDPIQVGGDDASVSAATGGIINGPGTGTSDSILARVSKGEAITKARAVSFWGHDFMRSINNMQIPRFNMGGLVGLMSPRLPRFAGGGIVDSSMESNSLGSVDLRTDHGNVTVMANKSAVTQLQRMAVTKRVTSTGRKPGFIG